MEFGSRSEPLRLGTHHPAERRFLLLRVAPARPVGHARRGHRPGRPPGSVRAGRQGLDGDPGLAGRALAAAISLVFRDATGDVEAPPRPAVARTGSQVRPPGTAVSVAASGAAVAAGASVVFRVLQLLCTVFAFRLDRERLRRVRSVLTQQVVDRQLIYLLVVQSVVSALAGIRLCWHKLRRTGGIKVRPAGSAAG